MSLTTQMITATAVIAAYKETKMKPSFRAWGNGIDCGCALTVMLKKHDPDALLSFQQETPSLLHMSDASRLSQRFVQDFVYGFDNLSYEPFDPGVYELGRHIRRVVIEHFEIYQREGRAVWN